MTVRLQVLLKSTSPLRNNQQTEIKGRTSAALFICYLKEFIYGMVN